jgi:hypothetical protein
MLATLLILSLSTTTVCHAVQLGDLARAVSTEADDALKRSRVLESNLKSERQIERARVREIEVTRRKDFKAAIGGTDERSRSLISAAILAEIVCCDGLPSAAAFVRATARHVDLDFASVLHACQTSAGDEGNATTMVPLLLQRWPSWTLFVEGISSEWGNLLLACTALPLELRHLAAMHPTSLPTIPDSARYARAKEISQNAKRHHSDLVLLQSSLEKRSDARILYGSEDRLRKLEGKCVDATGEGLDSSNPITVCPYRFVRMGEITSIFDTATATDSTVSTTFADVRYVTPCKSEVGTAHITTVTFRCPISSEGVIVVRKTRCSLDIEFRTAVMC